MKIENLDTDFLRKLAEGKPPNAFSHLKNSDSAWKPKPKPELSKPKHSLADLDFFFSANEEDREIHNSIKRTIEKLK